MWPCASHTSHQTIVWERHCVIRMSRVRIPCHAFATVWRWMNRLFKKFEEVFAWNEHGAMDVAVRRFGGGLERRSSRSIIWFVEFTVHIAAVYAPRRIVKDLPAQSFDLRKAPSSRRTPDHACVVSNTRRRSAAHIALIQRLFDTRVATARAKLKLHFGKAVPACIP